jgi:hypothetical protein
MTMSTNGEGVAVCRCGAELHVVCSGGCPEPDVVFKREHDPNAICNWSTGCDQPVGEHIGSGPPPAKCPTHRAIQRARNERSLAKHKAAS